MSPKYQLNKEDLTDILKVVLYSGASAMVGTLLVVLDQLDVPAQYLFVVSIINIALVSLKKWLAGR